MVMDAGKGLAPSRSWEYHATCAQRTEGERRTIHGWPDTPSQKRRRELSKRQRKPREERKKGVCMLPFANWKSRVLSCFLAWNPRLTGIDYCVGCTPKQRAGLQQEPRTFLRETHCRQSAPYQHLRLTAIRIAIWDSFLSLSLSTKAERKPSSPAWGHWDLNK
ncbi:uncharacterized protein EI97DRAFT_276680 [Westerdykella ornata]|uniref:Uncharacterized protein n=1 Tax=Westerdykella ornata TaxID=318751 RepID=A0A6A6JMY8_WESOR|nr:uncharacterized protein EI97DRAFT_276680 [Westerdykella ornata]KAF2277872.1 hypothetical protein EI97DRAFT_276680 [Westerdykella ornata]